MSQQERASESRQRLAYEAARIIVEQSLSDFERARRKAAERTGILDRRNWPSNEEVQAAILDRRRLFSGELRGHTLDLLRHNALEAMTQLRAFSPRLVGSVLDGSAPAVPSVQILLHAECPEDVVFQLMELRIPWRERTRSFRYSDGERRTHPVMGFVAGDIAYELVVLPRQALRNPPLSPVTERPERGADIAELQRLLECR